MCKLVYNSQKFFSEKTFKKIEQLIDKKIEIQRLNDEETEITDILDKIKIKSNILELQKKYYDYVSENEIENTKCPFCFGNINIEKLEIVSNYLKKILTREIEEYKEELGDLKTELGQMKFNISEYIEKYTFFEGEKVFENCKQNLEKYNQYIEELEKKIDFKKSDPYANITIEEYKKDLIDDVIKKIECFNSKINNVNSEIKKCNDKRKDYKETIAKIIKYEIVDELLDLYYKKMQLELLVQEKENGEKLLEELKENKNKKLESEKDVYEAVQMINKSLLRIFTDKKRLKLEYESEDGLYKIVSRGNRVNPKNISTGERNILALCYFFALLNKEKIKEELYSNISLLVIDDPISSFDNDNKIGIATFLLRELVKIEEANDSKCQIIMLTHDLEVMSILEKFGRKLSKNGNISSLMLSNRTTQVCDKKFRNTYFSLLKDVYDFAITNNPSPKIKTGIGNKMRRLAEAFNTFEFRKGTEDVLSDDMILRELGDLRPEYEHGLLFPLVLNSESHTESIVKYRDWGDELDQYSDESLQKAAQRLIMFIYKINKLSLECHMKENDVNLDDLEHNVNQWEKKLIEE